MAIPNQTGSGFTNVQSFLNANQNNGVGSAINNGIQGQVNQFNNDLGSGQSQFNSDIDAAKSNIDLGDSKAKGVADDASNLGAGGSLNDQQVTDYNNFTGSSYGGPTSLNNQSQLQGEANQAQQNADQTKTDSGRQGLLQQYVGQGQYSQGQQGLDNLLLNQTGGQQLQQARQTASSVQPAYNTAVSNATNTADSTANYLKNQQTDLNNQVTTGYQNIGNAAQANYNQLNSTVPTEYNNDLALLNADNGTVNNGNGYTTQLNLNSQLGQILGINSGQNIYDTKGTDLATTLQGPQNLTLAGTTAADKYAQYEALQKLAGNGTNIYQGQDPATVGTYQGISANQDDVQNILGAAQSQYTNQYNNGTFGSNNVLINPTGLYQAGQTGGEWIANPGYQIGANTAQTQIAADQGQLAAHPGAGANPFFANAASGLQGELNNYLGSIGQNRVANYDDSATPADVETAANTFNGIRGKIGAL